MVLYHITSWSDYFLTTWLCSVKLLNRGCTFVSTLTQRCEFGSGINFTVAIHILREANSFAGKLSCHLLSGPWIPGKMFQVLICLTSLWYELSELIPSPYGQVKDAVLQQMVSYHPRTHTSNDVVHPVVQNTEGWGYSLILAQKDLFPPSCLKWTLHLPQRSMLLSNPSGNTHQNLHSQVLTALAPTIPLTTNNPIFSHIVRQSCVLSEPVYKETQQGKMSALFFCLCQCNRCGRA